MIVIHRRLFWKIYLTLLCSLVAVAVLMGSLWWLLGESPRERWGAFRVHLTDELDPGPDALPGVIAEATRRLGEEMNADIAVYDKGGALLAAHGQPIALVPPPGTPPWDLRHMRIDLPDGRTVLARLRPPPGAPILHILTVMIIVAGGVALTAFPMTARLTRQLEGLRTGMARWGEGELAARVDATGDDEVALVARTFNAAAERLSTLLASQRALLANASHELRSPLARLRIAVELLLEEPAPSTHAEIVRNLGEVDQLVEEILLSSRLDHPPSTLGRIERVDLLGLAAEEATAVGATVGGDAVEIDGNATLLRRLLRNLLENAAKHGKAPIDVDIAGADGQARIAVSDRGPGIALEDRDRVFEPFYRPSGRSETGGGWGLGLSLVRQIAVHHGGSVICEAQAGGGSRFVVQLARTAPTPGTAQVPTGSIRPTATPRPQPRPAPTGQVRT